MIFPDKTFEKVKKFNYTKHSGNYFQKVVCQENDTYDEVLKKAMMTGERGLTVTRVKTKTTDGKPPTFETTISKTQGVFMPNTFSLNEITHVKPLLDRTHTPRGAKKAITLERCFDKDVWIYNKGSLDEFTKTDKDIKKGIIFKKKILR